MFTAGATRRWRESPRVAGERERAALVGGVRAVDQAAVRLEALEPGATLDAERQRQRRRQRERRGLRERELCAEPSVHVGRVAEAVQQQQQVGRVPGQAIGPHAAPKAAPRERDRRRWHASRGGGPHPP